LQSIYIVDQLYKNILFAKFFFYVNININVEFMPFFSIIFFFCGFRLKVEYCKWRLNIVKKNKEDEDGLK